MCDIEKTRVQLRRVITRNLHETRHRMKGRAFTVAFVGAVGAGKSSLINTIAAAMSTGSWRAHAYSGLDGRLVDPVTVFVTRFKQCGRPEEHKNPLIPTLLDIGGLPDQEDKVWEEALRLLLYGRVPEEENFSDVVEYVRNQDSIPNPKYTNVCNHLKVDRIIVVASAISEVPVNLLKTVMKVARPNRGQFKRSIPVFGVMTKTDLVDTSNDIKFTEREKLFIDTLGLRGEESRFARCINYCTQIDPDNSRIFTTFPYLDVPVLRLMTQVCDPVLSVVNADENYTTASISDRDLMFYGFCVVVLLLVLLILLVLLVLFSPLLK